VQNPSAIFTAGFHGVAATEPIFWHEKSSSCQELRLPGLDRNGFRSVTQGSVPFDLSKRLSRNSSG